MRFKRYKSILSNSFELNVYRGCNFGCIYCRLYSKCYHSEEKFDDIEVKYEAYKILDFELYKLKEPVVIKMGTLCEPYNYYEKKLNYNKKCLEIIEKYKYKVVIYSKSNLILKDLDILKRINKVSEVLVIISLSSLDEYILRLLEPNAPSSKDRLDTIKTLTDNGIDVIVSLGPIIPFINDTKENILNIIEKSKQVKAKAIIYNTLFLKDLSREHFYFCLDKKFVGLSQFYQEKYKTKIHILANENEKLYEYFKEKCLENELIYDEEEIEKMINSIPNSDEQLKLF